MEDQKVKTNNRDGSSIVLYTYFFFKLRKVLEFKLSGCLMQSDTFKFSICQSHCRVVA